MGAYKRKRHEHDLRQDSDDYNRAMASCKIAVEQGFAGCHNLWQAVNWIGQQKIGE